MAHHSAGRRRSLLIDEFGIAWDKYTSKDSFFRDILSAHNRRKFSKWLRYDTLFMLYDRLAKTIRIYYAEHVQSLYRWRRKMTQSGSEPTPITFTPMMADSSNLPTTEELLNGPLFEVAGILAIGEPRWADKHDEYLAETYLEEHTNSKRE